MGRTSKEGSYQDFAEHLRQVLGLDITCAPWLGQSNLPLLFKKRFACWTGQMLGTGVLFAVDHDPGDVTPSQISKQLGVLRERFTGPVVYVCEHTTALHRLRLIEQRVPFIVPGKQVYLPPLGIDLREHYARQVPHHDQLTPGAQVLLLAILLDRMPSELNEWIPTRLAYRFHYGAMTMVRAFDDLEHAGLVQTVTQGRRRTLTVTQPLREIWLQALPRLRTPVMRTHLIASDNKPLSGFQAGLTALAQQTMLSDPGPRTVAMTQDQWQSVVRTGNMRDAFAGDTNAVLVQVWSYDPALFERDGQVDPLSLALSLRDDEDDRTRMACEELLGRMPW